MPVFEDVEDDELDPSPWDTEVVDPEENDEDYEPDEGDEDLDDDEREKGYLRQADYTRKTQELAAERKALKERAEYADALLSAFAKNPQETLAILANEYGVLDQVVENDDELLPHEREILAQKNRLDRLEAAQRATVFEAELKSALNEYEIEADPLVLVQYMTDQEIGSARTAARLMALDLEAEAKTERREKVTATKRTNPVHTGGSRKAGGVERPKSFEEAARLAKRGIRLQFDD